MNTIPLVIIVLGVLIFFHELGHFLVARLFGVGVEKFSLGFGPRLLGKTIGRTDYRLSAIPLGGYVKMVGEEHDAKIDPEDLPYSFTHKHVAKRSAIVIAGPLFNALLALLIFFVIYYFMGIESIRPVVRNVEANSPAQSAGIQLDDQIVAIDEKEVASWRDINSILNENEGEAVQLQLRRQGEPLKVALTPKEAKSKNPYGDDVTYYDFGLSGIAVSLAIIGEVQKNMPAHEAGLQKGDRIESIDGQSIKYWTEMHQTITNSNGKTLRLGILRDNQSFEVEITPQEVKDRDINGVAVKNYRIGVVLPDPVPDEDKLAIELSLPEAFKESLHVYGSVTHLIFDFVKNAFKGKVSRDMVGGPIRIAMMAKKTAEMGFRELMFFVAVISLQLAILNLLPIPVLDGGHLLFYGIEAIKGGPLSIRARETAQQIGLFLLLLLMIFVIYNDIIFSF